MGRHRKPDPLEEILEDGDAAGVLEELTEEAPDAAP